MPELPEVETIRRQLVRAIKGKKIIKVQVLYPRVVRPLSPAQFTRRVTGAIIRAVRRRAKLILIELSNGQTMVIHLKLSGRLLLGKDQEPPRKLTELIFDLSGPLRLFYDDLRRFGFIRCLPTKELSFYLEEKEKFGLEVFSPALTVKRWTEMLEQKARQRIKPLLMDQKFLAGVGNIYAQEACFLAKIDPRRRAGSLSGLEARRLYHSLRRLLRAAIQARGTSSDGYPDLYGQEGNFWSRLKVYGRGGQPCRVCGAILKKMTLAGRGTVYCPSCQH